MRELLSNPLFWLSSKCGIGTSVEDAAVLQRIEELRAIRGFIRFRFI